MTRPEFLALLKTGGVPAHIVHFENSVADGYYILKNHHHWEVFFRERGADDDIVGFPCESSALEYLAETLLSAHPSIWQTQ